MKLSLSPPHRLDLRRPSPWRRGRCDVEGGLDAVPAEDQAALQRALRAGEAIRLTVEMVAQDDGRPMTLRGRWRVVSLRCGRHGRVELASDGAIVARKRQSPKDPAP